MSILEITTSQTGLVGTVPSFIYIETNDTYADVITPGYLANYSNQVGPNNGALVYTIDEGVTILKVITSSSGLSLAAFATSGVVVDLPTTIGHMAVYANTGGALAQDATPAINAGNIQAGISGTAGYFVSYPGTAAKGSLVFAATNNTNNYTSIVTNAQQGQSTTFSIPDPGVSSTIFLLADNASGQAINTGSLTLTAGSLDLTAGNVVLSVGNVFVEQGEITVGSNGHVGYLSIYPSSTNVGLLELTATPNSGNYTIILTNDSFAQNTTVNLPDPGNAIGQILVGATATPFTTGHLLQSNGTVGVVSDSGIAASTVQLKTNIKAAITGNIGGSGAGPLTVTVAGMTSSSVVNVTTHSSSNPCYVLSAVSGSGSFALTMSADPGATLTVNYVALIAAQ